MQATTRPPDISPSEEGRRQAPVRPHRWTRAEYERMGETGVLPPDARVELIEGEIVEMRPQGSRHATTISLVHAALEDDAVTIR